MELSTIAKISSEIRNDEPKEAEKLHRRGELQVQEILFSGFVTPGGQFHTQVIVRSIAEMIILIVAALRAAYRRFSELNSDSRNLRNWSRPAGSFSASSREKPHFFTRCWPGSRLLHTKQERPGENRTETSGSLGETASLVVHREHRTTMDLQDC